MGNVSIFSLIYFRVGEFEEEDEDSPTTNGNPKKLVTRQSTIIESGTPGTPANKKFIHGLQLYWTQFFALIVKRFIYSKRRYFLYIILSLVPLMITVMIQTTSNAGNVGAQDFKSLTLTKDMYLGSVFYYHNETEFKVFA